MKIEIDFDPAMISSSIGDILDSLPVEQKSKIATDVLTNWLTEPHSYERSVNTSKIIAMVKDKRRKSNSYYGSQSDEEIKNSWEFKEAAKEYTSSRETMVQAITDAAIAHYKEKAEQLVRNDPQIQQIIEGCVSEFVKQFPAMCQNALTSWFLSHIKDIQEKIMTNAINTNMTEGNLRQHLAISHHGNM